MADDDLQVIRPRNPGLYGIEKTIFDIQEILDRFRTYASNPEQRVAVASLSEDLSFFKGLIGRKFTQRSSDYLNKIKTFLLEVKLSLEESSKLLPEIYPKTISKLNERLLQVNDNLINDSVSLDSPPLESNRISSENEYSELVSKITALQDRFSKKLEEINETQISIKTEAAETIAGFQKSADQIFRQVDDDFNKQRKEFENKNQEHQDKFKTSYSSYLSFGDQKIRQAEESFNKQQKEFDDKLQSTHDEVEKIVENARELQRELTGRTLSHFFGNRAKEEGNLAFRWTIATWVFAVSTLITLAIIFYWQINRVVENKEIDFALLGTKAIFTATLGLIAKWTSKRANRHLTEESKYHRLAINTVSVESFTAKLDETSRNEIVKAFALKTFTEISENTMPTDFETASVVDAIKGLLPKADK